MKLCKHVEYDWSAECVTVTKGVAAPIFGWNKEVEGDVPLLKCSTCEETEPIQGVMVVHIKDGLKMFKKPRASEPEPDPEEMEWGDDEWASEIEVNEALAKMTWSPDSDDEEEDDDVEWE